MHKIAAILSAALVLATCAPAVMDNTATTPGMAAAEGEKLLAEAAALAKKGAYVHLERACRLYETVYAQSAFQKKVALPYFETSLLLALREREIGAAGQDRLNICTKILKENPSLAGFQGRIDLAGLVNPRVKGVLKDMVFGLSGAVLGDDLKRRIEALRLAAASDEMAAYLYLAVACPNKSPYDKKDDVKEILSSHPGSTILSYRAAFCPGLDTEAFQSVTVAEPEFYEAFGFIGEAALGKGQLISAERDILKAYERIPVSPYYNILLASIYFLTEEFERSIEFCDKSIELAPEYRDAYLTKAIGLSYLQRYQDAIEVLNKIIAMQYYLLGESHYWLSWNYHELKDNAQAQLHIEESKGRLPTNSEVFGLAGTIALENGELDRAEKEFTEALKYNEANTEALFGLAGVADKREKWAVGAGFYEKAADVLIRNEASIREKISQIAAAEIAPERKARMQAKKENQLRIVEATRASAYYSAAVDWHNNGSPTPALAAAEKAAAHPQFKDRAADLISRLKK